jgi:uncharacterized protein YkwD
MAIWERSPGHRANLLAADATEFGLAAAEGKDGRIYWALILASPG